MLLTHPSLAASKYAFRRDDKVIIDGIGYRLYDQSDDRYDFAPTDGGVAQSYSHAQMVHLVSLGKVEHHRGALTPEGARETALVEEEQVANRTPKETARAEYREAAVQAFLVFLNDVPEEYRKYVPVFGKPLKTHASVELWLPYIREFAATIYSEASDGSKRFGKPGKMVETPNFSVSSLLRWERSHRNKGLRGLYDREKERGYRDRRMTIDQIALLSFVVNGYMNDLKPSKEKIYTDVRKAFKAENGKRAEESPPRPPMVTPSRETVRRAINKLDPFHCTLTREGLEETRKTHAPVGRGLDLTRPLQRVEIDVWHVDLMTLMSDSGLLTYLTDEEKLLLGLDGKTSRWRLSLAICATTRCIVGMRLSRTARVDCSVATLEMILQDKGVWSDAVGALTPWHMAGCPELIVADNGNEFIPFAFRAVCHDLGIRTENPPAGTPHLRPFVERVLGTISTNLMPRLTGRTFSDIITKGSYDPAGRAALTADDFCAALIRWVVDVYHRTPHPNLKNYETPLNCWNRLTALYGVGLPPDLRRRRLACGVRDTRVVQNDGITFFGVQYHSEELGRWALHTHDRTVNVRWYPEDIGAIAVEINGTWIEVPSVLKCFNGVKAQVWRAAASQLRASAAMQREFDEDVIYAALSDIDGINRDAMNRIGLLTNDWSPERIKREEDNLFLWVRCQANEEQPRETSADDFFGEELPTATMVAPTVHDQETDCLPEPISARHKTTEPSVQGKTPPAKQRPRNQAGWGRAKK
jgi:putative transposase